VVVAALVGIGVPTLLTTLWAGQSYAGASDERIVDLAETTYAPYFKHVLLHVAQLALIEWAALSIVLYFTWLLLRETRLAKANWKYRFGCLVVVGWVDLFLGWSYVAHLHPGLFLSTLSSGWIPTWWIHAAGIVPPFAFAAPIFGLTLSIQRARGGERFAALMAGFLVLVCVAVIAHWQHTSKHPVYTLGTTLPELPKKSERSEKVEHIANAMPDILWIAVDSLRPDKIDSHSTPHLAKLVSESIYFPNTLVTLPRTGPSWAASLTSTSPLTNGIETMFPTKAMGNLSTYAMPSHLSYLGYRTAVYSEYAGEFFGRIRAGFQIRAVPTADLAEISAQMLLSRMPIMLAHAGLWYTWGPVEREALGDPLETLLRGLPNFAYPTTLADDLTAALDLQEEKENATSKHVPHFSLVFYSQPHFPYSSSAPYYRRHHVAGSSSALAFGRDAASDIPITTEADKKQVEALYRAALAETDDAVGRLLRRLEKRDRLNDTIIILSADHGEGLYDCDTCAGHGDNLRGLVSVRVPLAFRLPKSKYPQFKPKTYNEFVSQLDIYPTVLSLLSEPQAATHEGIPLIDTRGQIKTLPERTHFAETGEWLWATAWVPKERIEYPPITQIATLEDHRIVIDDAYTGIIRAAKYRSAIRYPFKINYEPKKNGATYSLFRLDTDPYEAHDISAEQPEMFGRLKNELRMYLLGHNSLLPVGDYFVTRPPMPPDEEW